MLGFKHQKVTPLWPRANGEVERFVKTLKKCIKAAKVEGRNWRGELQAILHNYRTTPHATTGVVGPAVLLLKRPVRNKLPQAKHIDPVAEIVRELDSSQKLKMKAHAANKAYVKPCNISPGKAVLVKRPFSVSKGGTVYDPIPMTVVSKKVSMITAEGENHTVTRNSSLFKNVHQPAVSHGNGESQGSGFGSSADKECVQEPPPALESANVPGPSPSNPLNTPNSEADIPSSSNLVPVPGSQSRTSQPVAQPPLRLSTRKRIPQKILDLQFEF